MNWVRYFVDAVFRGGDKHSIHGNSGEQMIRTMVNKIRKSFRKDVAIIIRLDSGFFDLKIFRKGGFVMYTMKHGFAVGSIAFVLTLISINNLYAFGDLSTKIDFVGDNRSDVQAFSDITKKRFSQRADIYDSVTVLATAPASLTALKFKWNISSGHRISATLPFNNKWTYINHWYTYQYPIHKDFTLELTPTNKPPIKPFGKTAEAHHPWFPTDIITNLLSQKKAAVGGDIRLLAGRDKFQTSEDSVSAMSFTEADREEYENFEASASIPFSDDEIVLHVYATVEKEDSGAFSYQYWAHNYTGSRIDASWALYTESSDDTSEIKEFTVDPESKVLIGRFTSSGHPREIGGVVEANISGEKFAFFAPSLVAASLDSSDAAQQGMSGEIGNILDEDMESDEETGEEPLWEDEEATEEPIEEDEEVIDEYLENADEVL